MPVRLVRSIHRSSMYAAVSVAVLAGGAAAQGAGGDTLRVGDVAPDFTLAAATRAGVSSKPVTLSELRGQTVVLAFFYEARTRG